MEFAVVKNCFYWLCWYRGSPDLSWINNSKIEQIIKRLLKVHKKETLEKILNCYRFMYPLKRRVLQKPHVHFATLSTG